MRMCCKGAARPLVGVLALLYVLSIASCGSDVTASGAKAGGGPQAMPVKVQEAQLKRVPEFTEYLATLQSRNSAVIMPQVEGYVTRISVHAGDKVERGEALLQIDPDKQQATVVNQEANLNAKLAAEEYDKSELERQKQLFAAGVVSRQAYDQARQAYDAAKADVAAARAAIREQRVQLRYYTVRAPETGIIGDIPVRVGDRVTTTTQLTTLDKGGRLEAYISIPADKAKDVRGGSPVDIFTEGTEPVRTKVTFVSPRVNSDDQTLLIKTDVPNGDHRFRNAEVVRARVIWSEAEHSLIPVTAVTRLGGQAFAFIATTTGDKSVAKQQPIELGDVFGNDYIVLQGIKPGDKIITSGVQILTDGMPVVPQGS